MIRHSKPLFISIAVHILIFAAILYSQTVISTKKSQTQDVVMCMQLSCIAEKKVVKKRPKKPKKVKPKPKPIIEQAQIKRVPLVEEKIVEELKNIPEEKIEEPEEIIEEIEEELEPEEKVTEEVESDSKRDQDEIIKTPEQMYVDENIHKIIELLEENLYYPRRARKRGIEDDVVVSFLLSTDGEVENIKIVSSNVDILSKAAIKTIEDISGEFPKPQEAMKITLPISYRLK